MLDDIQAYDGGMSPLPFVDVTKLIFESSSRVKFTEKSVSELVLTIQVTAHRVEQSRIRMQRTDEIAKLSFWGLSPKTREH